MHRSTAPHVRYSTTHTTPFIPALEWAVVTAILVAAILVAAWPAIARSSQPSEWRQVRVEPGQSLWELASEHPVAGLSTEQLVEAIRSANALDGTPRAGDVVRLPADSQPTRVVCQR